MCVLRYSEPNNRVRKLTFIKEIVHIGAITYMTKLTMLIFV